MARKASSFRRRGGIYKVQQTVLVICEDSKSSLTYLNDAKAHFKLHALVRIAHRDCTNTLDIVREAVTEVGNYDRIYCVVDRDRHERFDEALALGSQHPTLTVIRSYPCYEFWLLLHFGYTRKPYQPAGNLSAGDLVLRELKKQQGMQEYDKGDMRCFSLLLSRMPQALIWSAQVLRDAAQVGEMNPSTEIHILLNDFAELAKLAPVGSTRNP